MQISQPVKDLFHVLNDGTLLNFFKFDDYLSERVVNLEICSDIVAAIAVGLIKNRKQIFML